MHVFSIGLCSFFCWFREGWLHMESKVHISSAVQLSASFCVWPQSLNSSLNFCFSSWICRVGMLLSGLFRTLKEKMYLSVTFTNSGNLSLYSPLQFYSLVFTKWIPFFFISLFKVHMLKPYYVYACVNSSAPLFAYAGLQFHSDNYFARLHLINQWRFSAPRDLQ